MKIVNKKALHNYHIIESIETGIVLAGGEVKSIRGGRIDLGESHVKILGTEAFLINANIPLYQSSSSDYDAQKSRKLLLHRSQIDSLLGKLSKGGMTLVPVSIYEKNNRFKVEVGLARSKKEFDKRKVIKERDNIRRVEQELRGKE